MKRSFQFIPTHLIIVTMTSVLLIYSLFIHKDLAMRSGGISQLNYWDFVLSFISDPYLFIYFVFPIWLFLSVYHIEVNFDYAFIIRQKTYRKWILQVVYAVQKYILWYLIAIGISLLCIFLLAPYSLLNEWSSYSLHLNDHADTVDILSILPLTGLNPLAAAFFQFVYTIVFLNLITFILTSVYVFFQRKAILIILSTFFFVYAAGSFHFIPENLSFLSMASYAELYHGYQIYGSVYAPLVVMILMMTVVYLISLYLRNLLFIGHLIKEKKTYLVYFLLVFLGLASNILEFDKAGRTLGDFIFLKFYGVGTMGFTLLQHTYYSIVFLGFCYLYQVYLHDVIQRNLYYELIRYKSYKKWFNVLNTKTLLSIICFLSLLFIMTLGVGYFKGYQLSLQLTVEGFSNSQWEVLYHFFINGFLQVANYCFLLFMISWLSNESYYGLVGLGGMMVLMVPSIYFGHILPLGLNSFGLLHSNFYLRSLVLVIALIGEYVIIRSFLPKIDLNS